MSHYTNYCERQRLVVERCTGQIISASERHSDRTRDYRTLRSQSSYDHHSRCFVDRNRRGAATSARRLQAHPVCYASRSLSDNEKRYAVNEKEALGTMWACEKFSEYVLGSKLTLETDHRPLVPLLNSTELCKMPPRIQRFWLRLMIFAPLVQYVPGKQQTTADALSRAPVESPASEDELFIAEIEVFASQAVNILRATNKRLHEIRK